MMSLKANTRSKAADHGLYDIGRSRGVDGYPWRLAFGWLHRNTALSRFRRRAYHVVYIPTSVVSKTNISMGFMQLDRVVAFWLVGRPWNVDCLRRLQFVGNADDLVDSRHKEERLSPRGHDRERRNVRDCCVAVVFMQDGSPSASCFDWADNPDPVWCGAAVRNSETRQTQFHGPTSSNDAGCRNWMLLCMWISTVSTIQQRHHPGLGAWMADVEEA